MDIHSTSQVSSSVAPYSTSNKIIAAHHHEHKADLLNIPEKFYQKIKLLLSENPCITDFETIKQIEAMIENGSAEPTKFMAHNQITFTMFKMPDGVLYTRTTDHTSGKISYFPSLESSSLDKAVKPYFDKLV